ncbi:MAG: UDP-N-acetylmuramoyl-L-alanine--D-glutamate ligase [Planctomycetota bacterium]
MSAGSRPAAGLDVRGRRVTVMGLGLFGGGAGAARWALREGAIVTVTDLRDEETLGSSVDDLRALASDSELRFVLGRHEAADFDDADVVIVNPAVPPSSQWLTRARDSGAAITTATAILLQQLRARVVAVTGTNGKSSTVRFTADLLRSALGNGVRVEAGGNLGGSLLGEARDLGADDVVVLEMSSYQLEHLPADVAGVADVALITNVGVDHLERHGTVEAYRDTKLRIVDLVGEDGVAIVPPGELAVLASERLGRACRTHGPGGGVALGEDGIVREGAVVLGDAGRLAVPGRFQRANLVAALAAAHALGAPPEGLVRAIEGLTGLAHRMESLGTFELRPGGPVVEVVDNGVSTTPESTLAALESLDDRRRGVLVAGGEPKRGVDADALARRVADEGWTLVPFGAAAPQLVELAREAGARVAAGALETAEEAATAALRVAADEAAEVVLFSPACASFDRYPNFETRARAFRSAIQAGRGAPRPGAATER